VELLLERLTWPEVEAAIGGGMRTAIVCAASARHHGPHLPETTDVLLAEAYAVALARRLGDALVAPVIRPGCSEHHLAVAGGLSISAELLMQILDAYLESLRRHGFERFIVFSSHGGNCSVLENWERSRRPDDAIVISDLHV
jgi:creatinine amidohydrolase